MDKEIMNKDNNLSVFQNPLKDLLKKVKGINLEELNKQSGLEGEREIGH